MEHPTFEEMLVAFTTAEAEKSSGKKRIVVQSQEAIPSSSSYQVHPMENIPHMEHPYGIPIQVQQPYHPAIPSNANWISHPRQQDPSWNECLYPSVEVTDVEVVYSHSSEEANTGHVNDNIPNNPYGLHPNSPWSEGYLDSRSDTTAETASTPSQASTDGHASDTSRGGNKLTHGRARSRELREDEQTVSTLEKDANGYARPELVKALLGDQTAPAIPTEELARVIFPVHEAPERREDGKGGLEIVCRYTKQLVEGMQETFSWENYRCNVRLSSVDTYRRHVLGKHCAERRGGAKAT